MNTEEKRWRRGFAARLQTAMDERELNQTQLAARVGVHQSAVSDWLNELKLAMPSTDILAEVCRVLGVSADWVLFNRGSRLGGPAPIGEAYSDGFMAALRGMRESLEGLEGQRRGEVVTLPSPEDVAKRNDAAEQDRKMREMRPGVRRRRRKG